jgi:hypothetical protein
LEENPLKCIAKNLSFKNNVWLKNALVDPSIKTLVENESFQNHFKTPTI